MLLQAKNKKSPWLKIFHKKNRKGLDVVIGYVLLIAISIAISIFVYQWLKTYVPVDAVACSDGTSVFIKTISYNCTNQSIYITLKNNGKFSVDGYFIHASNVSDPNSLATIDLSSKIITGGEIAGSSIVFSSQIENSLTPDEPSNEKTSSFNVAGFGIINKIEIIPIRLQVVDNKNRVVSCSDSKIDEILNCVS